MGWVLSGLVVRLLLIAANDYAGIAVIHTYREF